MRQPNRVKVVHLALVAYLLAVGGCASPRQAGYDHQIIEAVETATVRLDAVSGRGVGMNEEPGAFYLTSKLWLRHGTAGDFRMMAADPDHPIRRAMGLVCMAATHREAAIALMMKRRYNTQHVFPCFAAGCVGAMMSESEFVVRMLIQPGFAAEFTDGSDDPLLGGDAYLAFCLDVLSRPSFSLHHEDTAVYAGAIIERMRPTPSLGDLESRCGGLSDGFIVLGIGRIAPGAARNAILESVLWDRTLRTCMRTPSSRFEPV